MSPVALADRRSIGATPPSLLSRRGVGLQNEWACRERAARPGEWLQRGEKQFGLVRQVLHSAGEPLGAASRALFEPRFGHDFSQVRVHSDAKAVESARAVNASAYALGNQIVFGEGQYAPRTAAGQRLIAHELTHVLQQRRGGTSDAKPSFASLRIGPPGDGFERQAKAAASSMSASSRPLPQALAEGSPCLRRQPVDEARTGQSDSDPLPYREAMETTVQGLHQAYQRACTGVDTLKRLEPFLKPRESPDVVGKELTLVERTEFSAREVVQRLERRVNRLPDILRRREAAKEASRNPESGEEPNKTDLLGRPNRKGPTDVLPRQLRMLRFDEKFIEPEFGPGYVVGSLADELAKARCELSKARWEFMAFMRTGRLPGPRRIPRG